MNFTAERRTSTTDRLRPAPSYSHPVTIHYEIQHHTTRMQKLTKAFKVYRLMVTTLVCVIAGLVIGLMCRPHADNWTERQFMYIELPGELYLRFLKLIIIPLLVSNVILSFGTIQGKITSQLGKVAGFLYLGSNVMAITVAILIAVIICPGKRSGQTLSEFKPQDNKQFENHHYFNEYHDSIIRYREYHPMFYHTHTDSFHPIQHSQVGAPSGSADQESVGSNDKFELKLSANLTRINYSDSDQTQVIELSDTEGENRPESTTMTSAEERLAGEPSTVKSPLIVQSKTTLNEINRIGLSTKLPIDVVLDVLRNLVPDSLVAATMQQTRTRLFAPKELVISKDGSMEPKPHNWPMGHEMVHQANIIGLLAMSVLAGIVLSHMEEASKPMLDMCACISELSLRIGMKAINLAPICIMFLLIGQIARSRDLSSMAGELLMYSTTVILALLLHGFVLLPILYYAVTKKSPFAFFMGMLEALVASFATSSSSATMALMLNCLSGLQLNLVIVRAFGPLGSVFNMNGTAIYEAIAVIFIAQTLGITLPITSLLLVGLSSAVASLSTSGIPSSGLMTMVIVLNAINMPVLQLSLIYIVDFIIDRFRTVVNVWSGAIICGIINHICPEHLFEEEMKPDKYREMLKYRGSRGSLSNRKSLHAEENPKPQVISVTITPPSDTAANNANVSGPARGSLSSTTTSSSFSSSRV